MPGWEGRGLAIVTNTRTNRKAYRRLPAQLEPARPRPCCETRGRHKEAASGPAGPTYGAPFPLLWVFSELLGGGFCQVLCAESKVLLKSLQVCLEKAGEKADVT